MHKSNILLPGIYLTSKICLNYSESPAMLSLRKQLWWIMNALKIPCKEMSENFSREMIDSHTNNLLCAFWIFTGLFLNLWGSSKYNRDCLNFMVPELLLSCFDFAWSNHPCFTTSQVCALKKEKWLSVRTHFVNSPKRFWAWIQRFCSPPPCPTPIPQAWLPSMAELPGLTGRVHSKAGLCKEAHKLVCGSSFYVQVAS